jgi:hypothetical protein
MRPPKCLKPGMWLRVVSLAALTACASGVDEEEGPVESGDNQGLIATQPLANGRTLLVYDVGEAAFFAERGDARIPSSLNALLAATETPAQTWSRLVPDQPAPAQLVALTQRIQAREAADPQAAAARRAQALAALKEAESNPPAPMDFQLPTEKAACGNICCDFRAMEATRFCKNPAAGIYPTFHWFDFDEPGSVIRVTKAWNVIAAVCSVSHTRWRLTYGRFSLDVNLDPGQGLEFSGGTGLSPGITLDSGARVVFGTTTHCGTAHREK